MCRGFLAADLAALVREAQINAAKYGHELSTNDFIKVLNELKTMEGKKVEKVIEAVNWTDIGGYSSVK
ncbi:hypothetical protein HK096_011068, partial [Nowakowskiella sp. JEL0078]